jgi:hypothetical protein
MDRLLLRGLQRLLARLTSFADPATRPRDHRDRSRVRSALGTGGVLGKSQITSLGNLSKWAFLPCSAGVGLNFDPA